MFVDVLQAIYLGSESYGTAVTEIKWKDYVERHTDARSDRAFTTRLYAALNYTLSHQEKDAGILLLNIILSPWI